MNKLLCCTLNGDFHSKWKEHDSEILCQGCITDLLEKEYGDYDRPSHDFTNMILQDFKFLHPTSDCNYECENEHLTEDGLRFRKII